MAEVLQQRSPILQRVYSRMVGQWRRRIMSRMSWIFRRFCAAAIDGYNLMYVRIARKMHYGDAQM
jgi:hypothetical protein